MLSIWCVVTSFQKLKDRSYKINIESWELTPDQLVTLDWLYQKPVFCVVWENPVTEMPDNLWEAIKQWAEKTTWRKSKSQLLRNVIYLIREKNIKTDWWISFNNYYDKQMSIVIEHYKKKIDSID